MPSDTRIEEFDYLRHGERRLKLRLFRPAGAGPFPLVVDLHGGAWCKGDLNDSQGRGEALSRAGLAVAALDFRHAGDGYPSSLVDINYALRWLKAHAGDFRLDAARVGLSGNSSGGHLAMLAAMRPDDRRYAALPLEGGGGVDANVRCVAMLWPVINPLSRYRYAKRLAAGAEPPAWIGDIPQRHDLYWKTEDSMTDGNPLLALERGEAVKTPPALWLQGRPDPVHDYLDIEAGGDLNEPERFARAYRAAGGAFDLVYVEQAARASEESLATLAGFFRRHL